MIYTGEIIFLISNINPYSILQEGYCFSSYFMAGPTEIGGGQTVCPKLEETLEFILDGSVGTRWLPIIACT